MATLAFLLGVGILRAQGQSDPGESSRPASTAVSSATTITSPTPSYVPPSGYQSLLDGSGQLTREITPAEADWWKVELHYGGHSPEEQAWLHLWRGEWELTKRQNPNQAIWHFRRVQQLASRQEKSCGFAALATAITRYRQGAYAQAKEEFLTLINPKTALPGYDRNSAALWARSAAAAAGYHAERARIGIPEPPRLNPDCGAAALAVCLKSLGLPHDKARVLAATRPTGFGNTAYELLQATKRLGVIGRAVRTDEKGLRALPKPVIVHVEHDHFVTVTRATKSGVTYTCADCGQWPGMPVTLTWKQWRKMEPDIYLTVVRPNSLDDRMLVSLPQAGKEGQVVSPGTRKGIQIASARRGRQGGFFGQMLAASNAPASILAQITLTQLACGTRRPAGHAPPDVAEAAAGDPVILATGEEEQAPDPDLTVYNPAGPSVIWQRYHQSLRPNGGDDNNINDYGVTWSRSYNVLVYDPAVGVTPQIPVTQTITVSATGTEAPGAGLTWEILENGSVIASSASANGWAVVPHNSLSSQTATVTPPVSASSGNGYKVRWKGPLNPYPSRSANFGVLGGYQIPQGGNEVILTPTGTQQPTTFPTDSWQVLKGGTSVAVQTDTQGWTVTVTADSKLKVRAPLAAAVGNDYEVRYRRYSYPAGYSNLSTTFEVIPSRLEAKAGTKYLVFPNYARFPSPRRPFPLPGNQPLSAHFRGVAHLSTSAGTMTRTWCWATTPSFLRTAAPGKCALLGQSRRPPPLSGTTPFCVGLPINWVAASASITDRTGR